eukprot:Hpha_TRINITY_DN11879_c0_g2::TRINITY_DN11879_c0_g2_i1::g.2056::m.2056
MAVPGGVVRRLVQSRRYAGGGGRSRSRVGRAVVPSGGGALGSTGGSSAPAVAISRTELVMRAATYPSLSPTTDPFAVGQYREGVKSLTHALQQFRRPPKKAERGNLAAANDNALCGVCAKKPVNVNGAMVHFLGVSRDSVRHARMAAKVVRTLRPDYIALPIGELDDFNAVLGSSHCERHMSKDYTSEAEFLKAERDLLEHSLNDGRLTTALIDRRLIQRVNLPGITPAGAGLLKRRGQASKYDHNNANMTLVALLHPLWEAQMRLKKPKFMWCGVSHALQQERVRSQTFEVEWGTARVRCDAAMHSGNIAEWAADWTHWHQQRLSPRAVVSDVNARHTIIRIKEHFWEHQPKEGHIPRVLLLCDATELHMMYGWACAAGNLSPVAQSQCVDPGLQLVRGVQKAVKDPIFGQVERSVLYDAPQDNSSVRVANAQDKLVSNSTLLPVSPLEQRAAPEHNPHLKRRPSKLIQSWDLQKPLNEDYVLPGETAQLDANDKRWLGGVEGL